MTAIRPAVAGVIGWPVEHSKSPLIHRFWLEKLGLDGDYSRFPVNPDELGGAIKALAALGLRGVNVTVPHKEAVVPLLDVIEPSAQAVGAVNTIVVGEGGRLSGLNTDVDGIRAAIGLERLTHGRVGLIGAGGAARAALHVLREAGIADVVIVTRTVSRGEQLLKTFGLKGRCQSLDHARAALDGCSVVVNASPMGMNHQPPMPAEVLQALRLLDSQSLVFDMVYAPLETELLRTARDIGLPTADGLTMLIGQAATAFERFFGAVPPRDHDAELRSLLIS